MEKVNGFDAADSFEDVDALLALVAPDEGSDDQMEELFVSFLDARLANKEWSAADLARHLNVRPAWVVALLNQQIPHTALSDDLLTRIAQALDYEPNLLRLLLNRPYTPTLADTPPVPPAADATLEGYRMEMERLLGEIEFVLDELANLYTSQTRAEERRARQMDYIAQIELIITRHRTDIKIVEILMNKLKATLDGDDDVRRPDIWRIIHHIRDNA